MHTAPLLEDLPMFCHTPQLDLLSVTSLTLFVAYVAAALIL